VPLGEATIRAIPPRRPSHWVRYALFALLLLSALAVAKWYLGRTEIAAVAPAVVAGSAGYQLVPALSDAASQVSAVAAAEAAAQSETSLPASKLSSS